MGESERSTEATVLRRVAGSFMTKLARASALMFAGTFLGGILGYVYQVLMARMLTVPDYGLFSAVMAVFAVCSAPLGALLMIVSRRVSEYRAAGDSAGIAQFYRIVSLQTAVAAAVLAAVALLLAAPLQAYLRATSAGPVYLFVALLFLSFFPIVNDGFLQGLQRFTWLSASGVLRILLRMAFCATLVWLGFGVSGAIAGTILAAVAGWIVTFGPLASTVCGGRRASRTGSHLALRPLLPVLVANTAFAAMTQLDIVLVNYYFPAREAGIYAAASVLGKAVMYLPGGIAMALFPMVAENHSRDRSSTHLLFQAVGLTSVLCLLGSLFYFIAGDFLVGLLYGEEYRGAGEILRYFGFAILPMALVMVAEYFLIAKGKVLFAYLFMVSAPLQLMAIHFWHRSLLTVVLIVAVSGGLLALVGYGMLWRAYRRG